MLVACRIQLAQEITNLCPNLFNMCEYLRLISFVFRSIPLRPLKGRKQDFFFFFEAKTSLGALSKNVVGIKLDSRTTLGSVKLVRVKSAQATAIWIGDRYMRQMKLFMNMTKTQFHLLLYVALSRVILIRYLILYVCVDQGTYYKFYFKKLKKNNTAHFSYTNCSLTTNI